MIRKSSEELQILIPTVKERVIADQNHLVNLSSALPVTRLNSERKTREGIDHLGKSD